jgi:hypothetical protein
LKERESWAIIKIAKDLIGKIPEKQEFRAVYQALKAVYHDFFRRNFAEINSMTEPL